MEINGDRDALRAVLVAVLEAEGATVDGSLHSWRCGYPEQFGACTCLQDVAEVGPDRAGTAVRQATERRPRRGRCEGRGNW